MRLEAHNLSKSYGAVRALRNVDIALPAGRVHALVGENGAGKSTLARILAGAAAPDAGTLLVDGQPTVFADRRAAIHAGVGLVPQQLSLVGELSLLENFLIDQRGWLVRRTTARDRLANAVDQWRIQVPLEVPTGRLSLAERQLGEVLLALAEGARALLLDEPTSSLGPVEVDRLVEQARSLAAAGSAVLLVTHRLDEVLRAADDVTVLRGGERVHSGSAQALDAGQLAELMVGTRPPSVLREERPRGAIRLKVGDLSIGPLKDINLELATGEIVGVAGVAGSGQRVLVETLAGLLRPDKGTVFVDDAPITGNAAAAARRGVAYIPEERAEGLLLSLPVADNAALLRQHEPAFRHLGMRRRRETTHFARRLCLRFDVRPPRPELLATALSGGNQQKLMVGRELERRPSVVIAHGPTQGLDIAATAAVRAELQQAAREGAAVLIVSADLDEVLALADRIVVLTGGRLVDELPGSGADLGRLGRAMAGLASEAAG
jgi:general nucleoside transport system ATP-binding protein